MHAILQWLLDHPIAALAIWLRKALWKTLKLLWQFYRLPPGYKAMLYLGAFTGFLRVMAELRKEGALPRWAVKLVDRSIVRWDSRVMPRLSQMAAIPLPPPRESPFA